MILWELMCGGKRAKGRTSASLAELRKGGSDGRPGHGRLQPEAGPLPQISRQAEAKDVEKLLSVRKEGS
jgi:hypothetical protein